MYSEKCTRVLHACNMQCVLNQLLETHRLLHSGSAGLYEVKGSKEKKGRPGYIWDGYVIGNTD